MVGLLSPRLSAADQINWLTADALPVYISQGPLAGQGIADLQVKYLSDHIPAFQYHRLRVNSARAWYEMEHGDGYCFHGVPRTANYERLYAYSRRPIVVPSYRVIAHRWLEPVMRPLLDAQGMIDLDKLNDMEGLVGGFIGGRSYFGSLQDFVTAGERKIRLERVTQALQLFNLFQAGRLDFVLATGLEAQYYRQTTPKDSDLLVLPIKGIPLRLATYTACSNGPLGNKMIGEIDKLQSAEPEWNAFLSLLQRWMDPADFAAAMAAPARPYAPD